MRTISYLLALDAGTGSIRAVLFDTKGKQLGVAQKEWTHLMEDGIENSMTFDTQTNWKLTVECIQELLSLTAVNPSNICALSASSMREGIVVYDKEGQELWGVANVDARASSQVKKLKNISKDIESRFYETSGQTFALGALPRLLWLKENRPALYENVATVSMISDWILAKLSGIIATDPSNAGTTGIFNLSTRNWDISMAKEVKIKENIFPPVYEPGTTIGYVTSDIAALTGLSTSTKVVMGGGDVQLGAAGLGIVKEGQVAVLGGSFWQQVVNIPSTTKPPKDISVRVNPHVISHLSQAEGITFFSGLVMRWFRDAFCELEKMQAQERGIDVYTLLEEQASTVPVGSYGILPIFSDSMNYGKWYHASPSFINLTLDPATTNKASMFRSLQENACIVSAINLASIKRFTGINIDEIVFAGGASKGVLWSQILADVTNCTVKIPEVTEATALGVAFCAGVGAGEYRSIEEAATSFVRFTKTYTPNLKNHKHYQTIIKQWKNVYQAQLDLVDKGFTTSMWKAPGL